MKASEDIERFFKLPFTSDGYDNAIKYASTSISIDPNSFIPYYHKAVAKIKNATDRIVGACSSTYR